MIIFLSPGILIFISASRRTWPQPAEFSSVRQQLKQTFRISMPGARATSIGFHLTAASGIERVSFAAHESPAGQSHRVHHSPPCRCAQVAGESITNGAGTHAYQVPAGLTGDKIAPGGSTAISAHNRGVRILTRSAILSIYQEAIIATAFYLKVQSSPTCFKFH